MAFGLEPEKMKYIPVLPLKQDELPAEKVTHGSAVIVVNAKFASPQLQGFGKRRSIYRDRLEQQCGKGRKGGEERGT